MESGRKIQILLYTLSAAVLTGGLASALYIYTHIADAPDNLSASMITGTKLYRRGLEMYGGKMNIIFDDFAQWFSGLWEGKNLAISVALLSLAASIILYGIAKKYPRFAATQLHS